MKDWSSNIKILIKNIRITKTEIFGLILLSPLVSLAVSSFFISIFSLYISVIKFLFISIVVCIPVSIIILNLRHVIYRSIHRIQQGFLSFPLISVIIFFIFYPLFNLNLLINTSISIEPDESLQSEPLCIYNIRDADENEIQFYSLTGTEACGNYDGYKVQENHPITIDFVSKFGDSYFPLVYYGGKTPVEVSFTVFSRDLPFMSNTYRYHFVPVQDISGIQKLTISESINGNYSPSTENSNIERLLLLSSLSTIYLIIRLLLLLILSLFIGILLVAIGEKIENYMVNQNNATAFTTILAICASVTAMVFYFFITSNFGIGITPDSVNYLSIARNLLEKMELTTYLGHPLITWPPLYPVVLAAFGKIINSTDLLIISRIINGLFLGAIFYLAMKLSQRQFPTSPYIFNIMFLVILLISMPLYYVSTTAWTETLFILIILCALHLGNYYLENPNPITLFFFSIIVSLATLTRYIGLSLVIWGGIVIVLFHKGSIKQKLSHVFCFGVLSIIPISLWMRRNILLSGTLTGGREPSHSNLYENIKLTLDTLASWYFSIEFSHHLILLFGLIAVFCLIILFSFRKEIYHPIAITTLFAVIYISGLIISSTIINADKIDSRLLSPVYIPLLFIFFFIGIALFKHLNDRLSPKIYQIIIIVAFYFISISPFHNLMEFTNYFYNQGDGYSGRSWKESDFLQMLISDREDIIHECSTIYSNGPDALYINANIKGKWIPLKGANLDNWLSEKNGCIIWFDNINKDYLYSLEYLQDNLGMELFKQTFDGQIYYYSK